MTYREMELVLFVAVSEMIVDVHLHVVPENINITMKTITITIMTIPRDIRQ